MGRDNVIGAMTWEIKESVHVGQWLSYQLNPRRLASSGTTASDHISQHKASTIAWCSEDKRSYRNGSGIVDPGVDERPQRTSFVQVEA